MVHLRFEGGAALAKELAGLSSRVSLGIQLGALRQGAAIIQQGASSMAPRAPGAPDLADNIGVGIGRGEGDDSGIVVGPTKLVFYGSFQEFGTTRHGAQPFMRPAFDSGAGPALGKIGQALTFAIIRAGGSTSRTGSSGGLL